MVRSAMYRTAPRELPLILADSPWHRKTLYTYRAITTAIPATISGRTECKPAYRIKLATPPTRYRFAPITGWISTARSAIRTVAATIRRRSRKGTGPVLPPTIEWRWLPGKTWHSPSPHGRTAPTTVSAPTVEYTTSWASWRIGTQPEPR